MEILRAGRIFTGSCTTRDIYRKGPVSRPWGRPGRQRVVFRETQAIEKIARACGDEGGRRRFGLDRQSELKSLSVEGARTYST